MVFQKRTGGRLVFIQKTGGGACSTNVDPYLPLSVLQLPACERFFSAACMQTAIVVVVHGALHDA